MRIRALVFEDNENMRDLLCELLGARGYEVLAFSDPSGCPLNSVGACPCQLDEACADIIISDVQMPHVTGLEFIEGQREKGCKVRNIALMSGGWTEEEVRLAEDHGYEVFHKPFALSRMLDWLDDCERHLDPKRKLSDWLEEPPGPE